MNREEALEQQVQALRDLLVIKDQTIQALRDQRAIEQLKSAPIFNFPSIQVQPINCAPGGCEYPSPWGATVPPHCKKCGKMASGSIVYTGAIAGGTLEGGYGNIQINNDPSFAPQGIFVSGLSRVQ